MNRCVVARWALCCCDVHFCYSHNRCCSDYYFGPGVRSKVSLDWLEERKFTFFFVFVEYQVSVEVCRRWCRSLASTGRRVRTSVVCVCLSMSSLKTLGLGSVTSTARNRISARCPPLDVSLGLVRTYLYSCMLGPSSEQHLPFCYVVRNKSWFWLLLERRCRKFQPSRRCKRHAALWLVCRRISSSVMAQDIVK